MKISTQQARNFSPTMGRIAIALAFASVTGAMTISPALGQYNESRARAAQDRDRYDDRNRNDRRERYDRRDQRAYQPAYEHPYRYSRPVYAPPPTYYYPEQRPGISFQSPGISLFFPLDLR